MSELAENRFAIILDSIGTATPAQVGSVAKGLGLAVEETVKAVYRAPIILASRLEVAVAEQIRQLLVSLGFESRVVAESAATPQPIKLYDVALQLIEPAAAAEVAREVARFCGTDAGEAMRLMFSPPGLVLGGVSKATTDALSLRLEGMGVELLLSRPADARFDLFATGLSATIADRLRGELSMAKGDPDQPIFVPDLDYARANRLWRTYGRSGNLLLVDRNFQQFDIILEGIAASGVPSDQADILAETFGIPQEIFPQLVESGEVILAYGQRYGEFESAIERLAALGIWARADLATFTQCAVSIEGISAAERDSIFHAFGLDALAGGATLTTPRLPVMLARAIQHAITAAGGLAAIVEN